MAMNVYGSAQVSATTRSSVQAQAAADAGVAVAQVTIDETMRLGANICAVPQTLTGTNPDYTVTTSCANTTELRIQSVGTAPDGSTSTVEAVFALTSSEVVVDRGTQRSLVIGQGDISALKPVSGDDTRLSLILPNGDYACWGWNERVITGDLIVQNGSATIGVPGCKVLGNIIASGTVTVQDGAEVSGNVTAAGTGLSTILRATVRGDVTAAGSLNLNTAVVGGNVAIAGNSNMGDTRIAGTLDVRGTLDQWGTNLTAGNTSKNPAITPVTLPEHLTKSSWIEYSFDGTVWDTAGYQQVTTSCTQTALASLLPSLSTPSYVVCPSSLNISALNLALRTDVAIVSPGGSFTNVRLTGNHQLALITSDANLGSGTPSCNAQGLTLTDTQVTAPARLAVYTPCGLSFGSVNLRGALIAGSLNAWGTPNFAAVDVNIPGMNLIVNDEGREVTPVAGPPRLGAMLMARNID